MILFSSASLLRDPGQQEWENPYIDVTQDMWSYQYITELNKAGVLPSGDNFHGQEEETRGNLVLYLYNMDNGVFADRKKQREKEQGKPQADPASFSDVAEDNPYYDAVYWAYGNGLVGGTTDTEFSPDHSLTREQVCTILARFAALEGISLIQAVEPEQFKDSLEISNYARSGVTACQMAGVVKGYEDNFFYPQNTMTKEECAAVVYRVMVAADMTAPEGSSLVDLTPGAYDSLYNEYKDITFTALVPASEEEGPTSFFDQAVFIGDSISMTWSPTALPVEPWAGPSSCVPAP